MFILSGDFFRSKSRLMDPEEIVDPVNIRNDIFIRKTRTADYGIYYNHWFRNTSDRSYWTASFLLPVGSVFVLTIVVLLMVLFKRCPQLVAAIVAGILGAIIVFTVLVTLNHPDVYS